MLGLWRRPQADELEDGEWDRDELRRRLALLASGEMEADDPGTGVVETHWAPRRPTWTSAPQGVGNFYCRQPGGTEYILIRVEPGDEYPAGQLEWAGPLPDPRDS